MQAIITDSEYDGDIIDVTSGNATWYITTSARLVITRPGSLVRDRRADTVLFRHNGQFRSGLPEFVRVTE